MRAHLSTEEFAALTRTAAEEIERLRSRGLLDPDGDGAYDELDVVRLTTVTQRLGAGQSLEDVERAIEDGTMDMPAFKDLLWGHGAQSIPLEEAADRVGLPPERIRGLRAAMGSPGGYLGEHDVEVIRGLAAITEAGMPWEAILEAARVFGDSLRRIAQTEVHLMHEYVHEPAAQAGEDWRAILGRTRELFAFMDPMLDPMLQFVHRHHLLHAIAEDLVSHLESADGPERAGERSATFLFADLSSFTALVQARGDRSAAEVLDRLDVSVRSLLAGHGGTLVKQIGDAFMLTFREPADAVRFALALEEAVAHEDGFPALRVGINAGPVVYRLGDYIGNTVNLAARLSGAAMPGEILLGEQVATRARDQGIPVEAIGARLLRGSDEPLPLYRVARARPAAERDPVCGAIVTDDAAPRLTRSGATYPFCSEDCLRRFLEAPDRFAVAGP